MIETKVTQELMDRHTQKQVKKVDISEASFQEQAGTTISYPDAIWLQIWTHGSTTDLDHFLKQREAPAHIHTI